jgi:hypothetical protein
VGNIGDIFYYNSFDTAHGSESDLYGEGGATELGLPETYGRVNSFKMFLKKLMF